MKIYKDQNWRKLYWLEIKKLANYFSLFLVNKFLRFKIKKVIIKIYIYKIKIKKLKYNLLNQKFNHLNPYLK